MRPRRISVADRNLRDPRYCCQLVSRREILTRANPDTPLLSSPPPPLPLSHPPTPSRYLMQVMQPRQPTSPSNLSPGRRIYRVRASLVFAELTVADRSAVGQSSIMDCTQSAANWEMIGATSVDRIVPLTIPVPQYLPPASLPYK